MTKKEAVLPNEIHTRIINYFLSAVDASGGCSRDPCGVIPFEYLIGTLSAIDTPVEYWDKVAMIILDLADNAFCSINYTRNLLLLSSHVSVKVRDKIILHFILRGAAKEASHMLAVYHKRPLTQEEILIMAEHNRHVETPSTSNTWKELQSLADENTLIVIKAMIAEILHSENASRRSQ